MCTGIFIFQYASRLSTAAGRYYFRNGTLAARVLYSFERFPRTIQRIFDPVPRLYPTELSLDRVHCACSVFDAVLAFSSLYADTFAGHPTRGLNVDDGYIIPIIIICGSVRYPTLAEHC